MSDGNALVRREACIIPEFLGSSLPHPFGGLDDEHDSSTREEERKKRKAENQMKHAKKKKAEKEAAEREVCILRETIAQVTKILSNALGEAIGPTGCTASLQGASGTSAGGPELGVVGRLAQRAADELVALRRTEPGLLAPPMPEPAPAPGAPVLGDWPILVPVNLIDLLQTIHTELPLKKLLKKDRCGSLQLGKERRCVLDITSYNASNDMVQVISTQLKKLLGISQDSSTRCTNAADVLKINPHASIGVYMHGNLTKAHGHFMGVLNILLGGTKDWRFWKPGPKPNGESLDAPDQILTQQEGQLLWIPPGWYHEVFTKGTSHIDDSDSRAVNEAKGVAHSFTCWHVPSELYLRMMASYASGQSEEAQGDGKKVLPLSHKGQLYGIFVGDPVRPVES